MVNTGKPSRGCYMCRARRIKCDEGKPGCLRCQKSKRICPGYRDAFELKLRDESKSTKKKLSRRLNQNQATPIGPNQIDDYGNLAFSHSRNTSISSLSELLADGKDDPTSLLPFQQKHPFITAHMTTPIDQQAACYFLSNFVLVPEEGTMRGYLDFVLPLMKTSKPSRSLVKAFTAVAFAALGTRPNSKTLVPKAEISYLQALKEINSALKDPRTASTDSTLASVMLMASFEQLIPSRMKAGGWGSHMEGAVAIIKERGTERFQQNPIFRDLFVAVRAHMTLNCISLSKAADPGVDWKSVSSGDPIVEAFAAANLKMASLRADTDSILKERLHSAENIENTLKLLRRAEAQDREYVEWIKALPESWNIKTVAWMDGEVPDLSNSIIHPGRVDAYGELWMAYKYNIVRACRLLVWSAILRATAWLADPRDYRLTPEYTTASRICRQLIEDIVASIPYFFGWHGDKKITFTDRSNFACGATESFSVKRLSGIFVMWPLFIAGASDFASPSQRVFMRGRLKHVAEMMGINQALVLFEIPLSHPSMYIMGKRICPKTMSRVAIVPTTHLEAPETALTLLSPPNSLDHSLFIPDSRESSLVPPSPNRTFEANLGWIPKTAIASPPYISDYEGINKPFGREIAASGTVKLY